MSLPSKSFDVVSSESFGLGMMGTKKTDAFAIRIHQRFPMILNNRLVAHFFILLIINVLSFSFFYIPGCCSISRSLNIIPDNEGAEYPRLSSM